MLLYLKDDFKNLPKTNFYNTAVKDIAGKVADCIKTKFGADHCCYKRHNEARLEIEPMLSTYMKGPKPLT